MMKPAIKIIINVCIIISNKSLGTAVTMFCYGHANIKHILVGEGRLNTGLQLSVCLCTTLCISETNNESGMCKGKICLLCEHSKKLLS